VAGGDFGKWKEGQKEYRFWIPEIGKKSGGSKIANQNQLPSDEFIYVICPDPYLI
jgi:hypothetical protein